MDANGTLWTDVEALSRLALTEQGAQRESRRSGAVRGPLPAGAFPPFHGRREFEVQTVESPARLVTGDYVDTFLLSERTLTIVMADVSGKGMPAALLMGFIRSMVRNVSTYSDSPGDTLTRVNRMLYDAELGPMYVTIFLGWYDTRTGRLRYANAGHPRPYRLSADGRADSLGEVTGPILGILDVKRYQEGEERIEIGERVVMYTDGVTEARSLQDEFFGAERLRALLEQCASEPAARMCELVARRVNEFQGRRRQDDATLLTLQRNA